MLISDQKRFIFVHIYKTGGSSITRLLGPWCEEVYRNPATRVEGGGWQGTWHFHGRQHAKLSALRLEPAGRLRDLAGHRICAIVRNPYTWALSVWNDFYRREVDAPAWFTDEYPSRSFLDFCRAMRVASRLGDESIWGSYSQLSFVADPELKPSFIGKFESLGADVRRLLDLLDIPYAVMPHEIENNPRERLDAMSFYSNESVSLVNELFADDFRTFGYPMMAVH